MNPRYFPCNIPGYLTTVRAGVALLPHIASFSRGAPPLCGPAERVSWRFRYIVLSSLFDCTSTFFRLPTVGPPSPPLSPDLFAVVAKLTRFLRRKTTIKQHNCRRSNEGAGRRDEGRDEENPSQGLQHQAVARRAPAQPAMCSIWSYFYACPFVRKLPVLSRSK